MATQDQPARMTKSEFWGYMRKRFLEIDKIDDSKMSAHRDANGHWTLVGGSPEKTRAYKEAATMAGFATRGRYPPWVKG